jgi:hypothetical protein
MGYLPRTSYCSMNVRPLVLLQLMLTFSSGTGTIDFAPYLSVKPALEFREWIGGEVAITEYCHDLALRGGRRLAEIMGTELMDNSENNELTLNMVGIIVLNSEKCFRASIGQRETAVPG